MLPRLEFKILAMCEKTVFVIHQASVGVFVRATERGWIILVAHDVARCTLQTGYVAGGRCGSIGLNLLIAVTVRLATVTV